MEKIIRDGKVAVAYSPGFGSGWSTWNNVNPMDAKYNQLFLDKDFYTLRQMSEGTLKGDDDYFYGGALEEVVIVWVEVGRKFIITEYDGSESIEFEDEIDWNVA